MKQFRFSSFQLLQFTAFLAMVVAWITDRHFLLRRIEVAEALRQDLNGRFMLRSGDRHERLAAIEALSSRSDPQSTTLLLFALTDPDPGVRLKSIEGIRQRKSIEIDFETPDFEGSPTRLQVKEILKTVLLKDSFEESLNEKEIKGGGQFSGAGR